MKTKVNSSQWLHLGCGLLLASQAIQVTGQDQVIIQRLGPEGSLTWSVPTTNSVSTVEWASSLDGPWHRAWNGLLNLSSNATVQTAFVPTFYRITTWTNGLLAEVRPGIRMNYRARDNVLGEWVSAWDHVGYATFPGIAKVWTMLRRPEYADSFDGRDDNISMMIFEATADKVAEYEGREVLYYQDAPLGTVWTNGYRETTGTVTITAREDITVPAGTFATIKHVTKINDPHCCGLPGKVITWIARGVGVVREERYREPSDTVPGRTYELVSKEMLEGPPGRIPIDSPVLNPGQMGQKR